MIDILKLELKPEYIEKLKQIDKKGNFLSFSSADDLKKSLEVI